MRTLRSQRVVLPGRIVPADVHIDGAVIAEITPAGSATVDVDLGNDVLMAGLVDCHVHINEPGRTEWEGFLSATKAAAAGGITTLVDMPLNSNPCTTSLAALKLKREAAKGNLFVNCALWGGVVPGNAGELSAMIEAGVRGFKCFLIDSGIDDFAKVERKDLLLAMPILAAAKLPLLVHAELDLPVPATTGERQAYRTFLASRPRAFENQAIQMMIGLAEETGCPVHIVHLSSSDALPDLKRARERGVTITVETCPHYLTFAAEEIPDRATEFKCTPPIRERENRERLWEGLRQGVIDFVVCDHSPCVPSLKAGDFQSAWGGIASLQFSLAAVWHEASRRGFSLSDVATWMAERPARFAGFPNKGRLAAGADADLVVWRPEQEFTVTPERILHRHKVTPYLGRTLSGSVIATYLGGVPLDLAQAPRGTLL